MRAKWHSKSLMATGLPTPPPRFAALRIPAYRRYFTFSLMSMMADNIEHVITYWVMFQAFHSAALGGFAVISHWVPSCLFSLYTGALADRHDCRRLIQISQGLFMAGLTRVGPALPDGPTRDVARGGPARDPRSRRGGRCAGHAVDHSRHGAGRGSAERDSPEREQPLPVHPARTGGGRRVDAAAGTCVGTPDQRPHLPAVHDSPDPVFPTRVTPHEARVGRRRPFGLADAWNVFAAVRIESRIMAMIVVAGATSFLVGNAFQAQMPAYANYLGADETGTRYTVLLAADAAGAILGVLLLETANFSRPSVRMAIASAGLWGLTMGLFPLTQHYPTAVALLVLAGVFNIAFQSMSQTLVQLLAPAPIRGRVVGLFNMAMLGLRAGSGLTVGLLGTVIGVRLSLALSSFAVVLVSVGLLVREVRARTRVTPETEVTYSR